MNKLFVFDFDGVLFPEPWYIHTELLKNPKWNSLRYTIYEHGYFPEHLHNTPDGKEYYEMFQKIYWGRRMSPWNIFRLQELSLTHTLVIASYNRTDQINRMLELSGIHELFNDIVTREHYHDKREMFINLHEKYSPEKMYFITDTRHDIMQVQSVPHDISIYTTVSEYISEDIVFMPDFWQ